MFAMRANFEWLQTCCYFKKLR